MDEMNLLLEARPEPAEPDLSRVRARLSREIAGERPRRRPGRLIVGLAVAAALAATVVLVPWDRLTGGKPTSAAADPRVVLAQAADYARTQPFVVPRPDQFLYLAPSTWLSIDGTHDGRDRDGVIPGCRNGFSKVYGGNDPSRNGTLEPCQVDPAYLPDLPTTVDAMVGYLEQGGSTNSIGKNIQMLLSVKWLSPRSKAAVFEAAQRIPGLSVVADAEDYQGEHGIGVRWGSRDQGYSLLVFDQTSHVYLGDLTLGLKGERGGSARTPTAIVDKVGQYPR